MWVEYMTAPNLMIAEMWKDVLEGDGLLGRRDGTSVEHAVQLGEAILDGRHLALVATLAPVEVEVCRFEVIDLGRRGGTCSLGVGQVPTLGQMCVSVSQLADDGVLVLDCEEGIHCAHARSGPTRLVPTLSGGPPVWCGPMRPPCGVRP